MHENTIIALKETIRITTVDIELVRDELKSLESSRKTLKDHLTKIVKEDGK